MMDELTKLQLQLNLVQEAHNNAPHPNFEGVSPHQMQHLLYAPFGRDCMVQFREFSADLVPKIPVLAYAVHLCKLLLVNEKIKLTPKGNLPVQLLKDMYALGVYKEWTIEDLYYKVSNEEKVPCIHMTKLLLELTGIVKKRQGYWSLTANGKKIAGKPVEMFKTLFHFYSTRFNLGYFDGYYEIKQTGMGPAFVLYLMHKYGESFRLPSDYATMYFKAFPSLLHEYGANLSEMYYPPHSCFEARFFLRGYRFWGLIETDPPDGHGKYTARNSPIFDAMFSFAV